MTQTGEKCMDSHGASWNLFLRLPYFLRASAKSICAASGAHEGLTIGTRRGAVLLNVLGLEAGVAYHIG